MVKICRNELCYVSDATPGITRLEIGKNFCRCAEAINQRGLLEDEQVVLALLKAI